MKKYLVTYTATVEVYANDSDEALDLGIADWEQNPDGTWEVLLTGEDGE
jgi:hypothetical protein